MGDSVLCFSCRRIWTISRVVSRDDQKRWVLQLNKTLNLNIILAQPTSQISVSSNSRSFVAYTKLNGIVDISSNHAYLVNLYSRYMIIFGNI